MSTELTCFVFGIPATLLWWTCVKKGIMIGPHARRVLKENDPLSFWIIAALNGTIAVGFIIAPVLSWLGLR
jgi:hypothetical protein